MKSLPARANRKFRCGSQAEVPEPFPTLPLLGVQQTKSAEKRTSPHEDLPEPISGPLSAYLSSGVMMPSPANPLMAAPRHCFP